MTLLFPSRLAALIARSAALGLPDGGDRHLVDAIHTSAMLRPTDLAESLSKADLWRLWIIELLDRLSACCPGPGPTHVFTWCEPSSHKIRNVTLMNSPSVSRPTIFMPVLAASTSTDRPR